MTPKRIEVIFRGRVQGIGFRFTVVTIAQSYAVVGYVCNRFDGTVELVAEGKEKDLFSFLDAILRSNLKRYIIEHTLNWFDGRNEFSSFGVKY